MAPRPVCELALAVLWGRASLRDAEELVLILYYLSALLLFPGLLPLRRRVEFRHQFPAQMKAAQAQFDLPEHQLPVQWEAAAETEVCPQNQMAAYPLLVRREVEAGVHPLV